MKKFLITAAIALSMTTAALAAKPNPFYTVVKGKYWETLLMAKSDEGHPLCMMTAGNAYSRFYIKWSAVNGMRVQVFKTNWRLPDDVKVPLQLEFKGVGKDDLTVAITAQDAWPYSQQGVPGASVFMEVGPDDEGKLLFAFSDSNRMQVNFLDGDEPSWTYVMEGSRKAVDGFRDCVDVVKKTVSTQPINPKAGTSPVGKKEAVKKDDGGI